MKSDTGFSDITSVLSVGKAATHGGPSMKELKEEHRIGTIVDLNDTQKEGRDASRMGLEYVGRKLPLIPTASALVSISETIDREVRAGRKVFVHCHQGIYRAPTVAVAYLIFKGLKTEDAVKQVRLRRPSALPGLEGSQKLLPVIKEFESKVRGNFESLDRKSPHKL